MMMQNVNLNRDGVNVNYIIAIKYGACKVT